jgi:hypothetical protein
MKQQPSAAIATQFFLPLIAGYVSKSFLSFRILSYAAECCRCQMKPNHPCNPLNPDMSFLQDSCNVFSCLVQKIGVSERQKIVIFWKFYICVYVCMSAAPLQELWWCILWQLHTRKNHAYSWARCWSGPGLWSLPGRYSYLERWICLLWWWWSLSPEDDGWCEDDFVSGSGHHHCSVF